MATSAAVVSPRQPGFFPVGGEALKLLAFDLAVERAELAGLFVVRTVAVPETGHCRIGVEVAVLAGQADRHLE
jgi:hypothetical protein